LEANISRKKRRFKLPFYPLDSRGFNLSISILGAQACALPISSISVRKKFAQTKPPTLLLLCEIVGGYT